MYAPFPFRDDSAIHLVTFITFENVYYYTYEKILQTFLLLKDTWNSPLSLSLFFLSLFHSLNLSVDFICK